MNLGMLPLAVYFIADTMSGYFLILSSLTLLFLLSFNLLFIPLRVFPTRRYLQTIKKLSAYGIQRIPGDVLLGFFFAIPTFIATNYFSLTLGGALAFCLSLFNIVIALMSPVNIILLPKASRMVHEKDHVHLRKVSYQMLFASLGIGVLVMIVVGFFGQWILELFNVANAAVTSVYLKIIFSGIIGFSIFSVVRSIIDAYHETARVSSLIVVSFTVFIASLGFLKLIEQFSIEHVLLVFVISINLLGLFTFVSLLGVLKSIRR